MKTKLLRRLRREAKKGLQTTAIDVMYHIGNCEWKYEHEVFPTKEELLNSL